VNETSGNVFIGTPRYMAPELFRGGAASVRSDIWGVGGLLHYAATGRPPHDAESIPELIDAVSEPRRAPARGRRAADARRSSSAVCDATRGRAGARPKICARRSRSWPPARRRRAGGPPGRTLRGLRVFEASTARCSSAATTRSPPCSSASYRPLRAGGRRLGHRQVVALPRRRGAGVVDGQLGDRRSWSQITLVPGRGPDDADRRLARALDVDERNSSRARSPPISTASARAGGAPGRAARRHPVHRSGRGAGDPERAGRGARRRRGHRPARRRQRLGAHPVDGAHRLSHALSALLGIGEDLEPRLYVLGPLSAPGIRDAIVGPARVAASASSRPRWSRPWSRARSPPTARCRSCSSPSPSCGRSATRRAR
jgi:hypothetical protein